MFLIAFEVLQGRTDASVGLIWIAVATWVDCTSC